MRAASHTVLAVAVVVAAAFTGDPADVDSAAVNMPLTSDIATIAPARGELVGVAHPVVVTFKSAIANSAASERAITVKSTPAMTGRFEWLDDHSVQWVPERFWPAHTTVMLSVGGARTEFATGAEVVGIADVSEHTFTVTIDGREADSTLALPSPHHLPHAGEPGVLLASMGRPEFATPVGTYPVLAKERSVLMDSSSVGIPVTDPDGYLLDVEYAVRITRRGLFVHGAPWAVNTIGYENTSHGCVSLIPAAAEWFFNIVKVGDPVIVQE